MILKNLKKAQTINGLNSNFSEESLNKVEGETDGTEENRRGGSVSWELSDSFHLRLLIHYIGDIHQPLHTTSRFTKHYPNGDEGGNYFDLLKKDDVTNLHALWDSALYYQAKDFNLPLNDQDWIQLGNISDTIRSKYPKSELVNEIQVNHKKWQNEGLKIASDFVYTGLKEGEIPSDSYLD